MLDMMGTSVVTVFHSIQKNIYEILALFEYFSSEN